MKIYRLLILWFLMGCLSDRQECTLRHVDLNNHVYNIKGCLVDSLENGNWYLYDTLNRLSEWGYYDHGIKKGKWHYVNNKVDSVLIWEKYRNDRLDLITNIPDLFTKEVDSSYFVKFKSSDSTRLLNLVIAVGNPLQKEIGIDSFYKISEHEIAERNYSYNFIHNQLISKKGKYFSSWYKLYSNNHDAFEILTFYGMGTTKFIEITCTYDKSCTGLAANVFSSVISNLFIGSDRFIDPFDKVDVKKLNSN